MIQIRINLINEINVCVEKRLLCLYLTTNVGACSAPNLYLSQWNGKLYLIDSRGKYFGKIWMKAQNYSFNRKIYHCLQSGSYLFTAPLTHGHTYTWYAYLTVSQIAAKSDMCIWKRRVINHISEMVLRKIESVMLWVYDAILHSS